MKPNPVLFDIFPAVLVPTYNKLTRSQQDGVIESRTVCWNSQPAPTLSTICRCLAHPDITVVRFVSGSPT